MSNPPTKASLKDDESSEESREKAGEGEPQKKKSARSESPDDSDERICTYRDFSHIQAPEPVSTIPRNPSHKEATFPMKLHAIVSNPDIWEISWMPHGRSWRINNAKSFEERVIPLFFRHGRYASFSRQVNGWGFRRITVGTDFNSYYHGKLPPRLNSSHFAFSRGRTRGQSSATLRHLTFSPVCMRTKNIIDIFRLINSDAEKCRRNVVPVPNSSDLPSNILTVRPLPPRSSLTYL